MSMADLHVLNVNSYPLHPIPPLKTGPFVAQFAVPIISASPPASSATSSPAAMDFWQRARTFAEEAATKTHELTLEAAKRSQDLTIGSSKLSDLVSEAAKRSREIAAEASKKSLEIADQIKSQIPAPVAEISSIVAAGAGPEEEEEEDVERFGVTDELRDFVKGITGNTFRDFPLEDDSEVSDIPTVSNVRQDLTEWQEKHAKIVLSTVKEISKLRYELCPRAMKERKFWRIYFILVNSHVSPYERRYTEEAMLKSAEVKDDKMDSSTSGTLSKSEAAAVNQNSKKSSANEQDLDVFLLGDLGDSDEGPDDGDRDFDDDLDKL